MEMIEKLETLKTDSNSQLYEEIKELNMKLEDINIKMFVLNEEKRDFETRLYYFLDNKNKIGNYDNLAQEQFNSMKEAFIKELKRVKEDSVSSSQSNKRAVTQLKSEINSIKNINVLLLQRIDTLNVYK